MDYFKEMRYLMTMGIFAMIVCLNDLHRSLDNLAPKQRRNLRFSFGLLFACYITQMSFTKGFEGKESNAGCDFTLKFCSFLHLTIKVMVSFLYTKRVEIALSMSKKSAMSRRLKTLQILITLTYFVSIERVLTTYSGTLAELPDGSPVCDLDMGGNWSWADEIAFGVIDLTTLGVFAQFYFTSKDKMNKKTAATIFRILVMSSITFLATVFAIVINMFFERNDVHASLMDSTTDIISLQKTYTKRILPQEDDGKKAQSKLYTTASRLSVVGDE